VDTLSGPPRTTVRRNDEVVTFVPEEKLSVHEKRDMLGLFPSILQSSTHTIGEHYLLKPLGWTERVAGFEADVVELRPKDDLRFGYRIWSEKKTALIVKLQTLDTGSRVLEQVAFSALQLDAPVKMNDLLRAMRQRTGYSVQKLDLVRTTPQAQGWQLKQAVPGFSTLACHLRPGESMVLPAVPAPSAAPSSAAAASLQWVLSDGLASVSVFIEPFDPARHTHEGQLAAGATHSLSRRHGLHWVTWVGEVPFKTLLRFAVALERVPGS
jgi:sigma-E factor negative regulatory protein RseB